ncbi:MAG: NAD(P)/FAD-dependent oxidoreductase [Gammaproteobacteria bacterium]
MLLIFNTPTCHTYDYVIIGGGLFGSAVCEQLVKAKPGAQILLIDADNAIAPTMPRSSIGHARLARSVAPETDEFYQTLAKSVPVLKKDAKFSLIDLCTIWKMDDPKVEVAIGQLKENHINYQIIKNPHQLKEKYSMKLEPGYMAIIEKGTEQGYVGLFDPSEAVESWQKRARSLGVNIISGKVQSLSQIEQTHIVALEDGKRIRASKVIVATGSQTPEILPQFKGLIVPQPVPLIYVDIPQEFPDGCTLWVDPEEGRGIDLFCMTDKSPIDGKRVLKAGLHIAKYSGRQFANASPAELESMNAQIETKLRKQVHGIGGIVHTELCYYGNTQTGLPYIGNVGEGVYVFAGGNGSCAKHAYALATQLVLKIVNTAPEINMKPFSVPEGVMSRSNQKAKL